MNLWEHLKPPLSINEIKEIALSHASRESKKIPFKGRLETAKARETTRLRCVYKVLKHHIFRCLRIYEVYFKSHPFYRELVTLIIPEEKIIEGYKRIKGSIKVLEKLYTDYTVRLNNVNEPEEAAKIRKEGIGRMLSILDRQRTRFKLSIDMWKYAHKLPSISFNDPIVVVSGPPNVGKSSLVNELSSAEVKVASYPFTTREIHLGHIDMKFYKIQLVDTPGLLDRPLSERNEIELKAIYALKYLPNLIIFMLDPSKQRYYEPDKQIAILRDIKSLFPDKPYLIVINKIDDEDIDLIPYLKRVGETKDVFKISIKENIGVETLKSKIISIVSKSIS